MFQKIRRGIKAYAKQFNVTEAEALATLVSALAYPYEGEITCALCYDDTWWQNNYGTVWQAAQWWYCGPFGLDCPPRN